MASEDYGTYTANFANRVDKNECIRVTYNCTLREALILPTLKSKTETESILVIYDADYFRWHSFVVNMIADFLDLTDLDYAFKAKAVGNVNLVEMDVLGNMFTGSSIITKYVYAAPG